MERNLSLALLVIAFFASTFVHADDSPIRDIYADTWVGTDALGRSMPTSEEVGPPKTDHRRVAGMFYITWHTDSLAKMKSPYQADVSKVLGAHPEARLNAHDPHWTEGSYHWGEPEMGYFLSSDPYVIRHDMSMLADAGVDVLVMDVTNAVCYWDQWEVVFSTMQKMKAEGNKVPRFCFWAFNGPVIQVVQDLYDRIYKTDKYKDLWFDWDGKPLLLYNANPSVDANGRNKDAKDYSPEVKSFFTLRNMWWGYYKWAGKRFVGTEDNWSFGYDLGNEHVKAMDPVALASTHDGKREEFAVTPAQHPSSLIGKSWSRAYGEPELNEFDLPVPTLVPWLGKTVEHPEGYGIYFQERWDEALKADPQFLYLNDWNEWTAGKYQPGKNKETTKFMRRDSQYFFVDQYNAEFNRTIQPMKGGYTDNYYMQLAENMRRYKGARPIPELHGEHAMKIDGDFADWKPITTEYRDTIGDTIHRDHDGYGGEHYKNDSGRNDLTTAKVAFDADNVYFYAETHEPITSHSDKNWMLLLIDSDKNASTGWHGYDVLINHKVIDENTTTLMRYDAKSPEHPWVEAAKLNYRVNGKAIELAIPRDLLGASGAACTFDFKWADNPADLKDPISLCVNGDTAPNRRFNYRCIWKK
jgi:hypothetical protein